MNILFIESSIPPYRGGVQRVSWQLRNYFLKCGNDVFFAFHLKDSEEVDNHHKLRYDNDANGEKLYPVFKRFTTTNKINVVIIQGHCGKTLLNVLYKIKTESDVKLVGCFHLSPDFERFRKTNIKAKAKSIIKKWLMIPQYNSNRHFYDVVDKFVLLSTSFIEGMCKAYQLPNRNKLVCIPNPLSFDSGVEANVVLRKKKIVLIVTRFEETQKNIMSALRIWKNVEIREESHEWKLVLGGYGPDETKILSYAKYLNLERFEFVGKVDDAQKYFETASIFMMTSSYEGFGMTLTEALQNGCVPIAFNNFSVLHDIIQDGENGIITPSGEEKIYTDRLLSLMKNDKERISMAIKGIESSGKFSLENVGAKWIELFEKI